MLIGHLINSDLFLLFRIILLPLLPKPPPPRFLLTLPHLYPLRDHHILHPLSLIREILRLLTLNGRLAVIVIRHPIEHLPIITTDCVLGAGLHRRAVLEDGVAFLPEDRGHVVGLLEDYGDSGEVVVLFCCAAFCGVGVGHCVGTFLEDGV